MKIKLHDIDNLNNNSAILMDFCNCEIREPLILKEADIKYSEDLFEGYVILSDNKKYTFSIYYEISPYNSKELAWIEYDNEKIYLNTKIYYDLLESGRHEIILRTIGIIYYGIEYNGFNKEKLIKL